MNKNTRIRVVITVTCFLLLSLTGVILYFRGLQPDTPGIALYRISAPLSAALAEKAQDPIVTGGTSFSIIVLDDTQPLEPQLEKNRSRINLLFAPIGQASAALTDKVYRPAERTRRLLPTTIRNTGNSGNKSFALPILMDHFEAAVSRKHFPSQSFDTPLSVNQMLQMARTVKTAKVWPIICAGSRDEDLLLLAGSLVHSLYGIESYRSLVTHIRAGEPFDAILAETPLQSVLETLLSWRRERLLHPQWLEMTNDDLEAFMRFDSAAFVFMPLSTRRMLDTGIADKYESYQFPVGHAATSYPLTAPVYAGIRIKTNSLQMPRKISCMLLWKMAHNRLFRAKPGLHRQTQKRRYTTSRHMMSDIGQLLPWCLFRIR